MLKPVLNQTPRSSFQVLREEMLAKIPPLLAAWDAEGTTPREAALRLADWQTERNRAAEAEGTLLVSIP